MKTRIWPALAALATGALCAGLAVAPARAGSTPSTPVCVDKPNDADCDGVSPFQSDGKIDCWNSAYEVPRLNPDINEYGDFRTRENYEVILWYSKDCGTNWAQVYATGTGDAGVVFAAKVRRAGSANAGYLMEHGIPVVMVLTREIGVADSPMVYSPNNAAQACLSLPPFSGLADQIACTSYH